ncbi:MAG: HAMP domain-containing histidine kinase [Defluviitaleaceae bacterium]|nr:HAMP domain-containing histidine kinase [Defluviitaleaceae bacterium]
MRTGDYELSISEMAAALAHEVRNPLGLAMVNIGVLEGELTAADKARISSIRSELYRINEIVSKFTDIVSMLKEHGETEFRGFVDEAITPFITAYNSRVNFNVFTPNNLTVKIPKNALGIIFNNIIKNAVEAVMDSKPECGEIGISVEIVQEMAVICVNDNGKGLSVYEMEKALISGFTTKKSGMGVGLHVSLLLAKRYGGSLDIYGEENNGCTVTLKIPIA